MSENLEGLKKKIEGIGKLGGVVKTMKTLAASQFRLYEKAELSLNDYQEVLRLALTATPAREMKGGQGHHEPELLLMVFGSDQGLVGAFNEQLNLELEAFTKREKRRTHLALVGDKLLSHFETKNPKSLVRFQSPQGLEATVSLLQELSAFAQRLYLEGRLQDIFLLYQKPDAQKICVPIFESLFSFNEERLKKWPSPNIPELLGSDRELLLSLRREFLFVKLLKASVASLTSESASRLAAMQRAEKNIGEVLEELNFLHQRLRQELIDAELFDIISGFKSLSS